MEALCVSSRVSQCVRRVAGHSTRVACSTRESRSDTSVTLMRQRWKRYVPYFFFFVRSGMMSVIPGLMVSFPPSWLAFASLILEAFARLR